MDVNKQSSLGFFKWLIRLLLSCVALLLIITLSLVFWFHTNHAKEYLHSLISSSVKDNLGYAVEINNLQIKLPLKIHIKSLKILDNKGVWLEARNTQVDIPFTVLFSHRININVTVHDFSVNNKIACQII